jgi:hypothetical protein
MFHTSLRGLTVVVILGHDPPRAVHASTINEGVDLQTGFSKASLGASSRIIPGDGGRTHMRLMDLDSLNNLLAARFGLHIALDPIPSQLSGLSRCSKLP